MVVHDNDSLEVDLYFRSVHPPKKISQEIIHNFKKLVEGNL